MPAARATSTIEISAHGRVASSRRMASSRVLRRRSRAATAYGTAASATVTSLGGSGALEVDLVAYAAVGARPVIRNLAPGRPRREALTRVTGGLVVDVPALRAGVGAHA